VIMQSGTIMRFVDGNRPPPGASAGPP